MTDPTQLTGMELLWLSALISLFGFDLYTYLSSRDRLALYQPPVFVIGFMSYYCLLGPINRLIHNDWVYRLRDYRYAAVHGWAGAVIFYLSFRLGYGLITGWFVSKRFTRPFDEIRAARYGRNLCWLGLGLFSLVYGLRTLAFLTPFGAAQSALFGQVGIRLGGVGNYATASINLLIPGVLLMFASWIRRRHNPLEWISWSVVATLIYTSLGFRFRVVILVVPLALLWFLCRGRRPALLPLVVTALGLLAFAGFVGATRSYGSGLNLQGAQGLGLLDFLTSGLDESAIFMTTGGMIANAPERIPFVGIRPLISTLLFPIPSQFLPDKDSADYLLNSISALYGSKTLGLGDAILNYAEYYLMYGWISVVAMGLVFGGLFRSLWNWFTIRRHETLAQVAYMATVSLIYIWVSRGYMPQVALTFGFGSLPLFWLYYKRSDRRPATRAASPPVAGALSDSRS